MFDNSIEPNDPGVDQNAARDVAEMLLGTRLSLRVCIEEGFGYEPLPDLIDAVLQYATQCKNCSLWINAEFVRCSGCAKNHASKMDKRNFTIDYGFNPKDQALLKSMGVKA